MRKPVWYGASLLAVTAAAVGLLLVRSERPASAGSVTVEQSLLALLPPNANSLVGVDVGRLKSTALYRHLEEESRKGDKQGRNQLDEFIARTGFDPRRDVEQLLVAFWTEGAAPDARPAFLAVARGSFNRQALGLEIRSKKAGVESYRGFEVFGPEARQAGRADRPAKRERLEDGRFVFLDDRTALAGTTAAVFAALDRKVSGGPSLLANSGLLNRAQTISAANQIWAVSETPGEIVAGALPPGEAATSNFARIFSSMQNSTFGVDLVNGLDVRAAGVCRTAQDAKTLADAVRGVVAFGRLAASQNEPELMTVFDGIEVHERDTALDISVRVDQVAFEKLLQKTRSKDRGRHVRAAR